MTKKFIIMQSVGGKRKEVRSYADLAKHHPSAGREPGRQYREIDGQLEEIRERGNGWSPLIKKDFYLIHPEGKKVFVPAPVTGYVFSLGDKTNAVRIYSTKTKDTLLAQLLHSEPNTSPRDGHHIEYGEPLAEMGDTGSPGSLHVHMELSHKLFQTYIADIVSGKLAPQL
jgi:hypothetical protein